MTSDLAAQKRALRAVMQAKRRDLSAQHPQAGDRLAALALPYLKPLSGQIVAFYYPLAFEMDPRPLAKTLAGQGCNMALPTVVRKGEPLLFRAYAFGDALRAAGMGVMEPLPQSPEAKPDWLLIPLLAFDAQGGRLGYGGGFYDRSLRDLRRQKPVTAIGLAYAGQELPSMPLESWDEPLDAVVTETGFVDLRR